MWGWPIALYLFFGGLSAGAFASSACIQLAHGPRFFRTVQIAALISCLSLAIGVCALLLDVGNPLRALNMIDSFACIQTSWMARGAWALLAAGITYGSYVLVCYLPVFGSLTEWLAQWRHVILNVIGAIGILVSMFLGFYSGALLADSVGITAWRTPFLPALFLLSALESGGSVTTAILGSLERPGQALRTATRRWDGITLAIMAAELAVFAAYAVFVARSATLPTLNTNGPVFGNPVAFILLFAIAFVSGAGMLASHLFTHRRGPRTSRFAALCSCLAGMALRLWVLSIGVHTNPLAI